MPVMIIHDQNNDYDDDDEDEDEDDDDDDDVHDGCFLDSR